MYRDDTLFEGVLPASQEEVFGFLNFFILKVFYHMLEGTVVPERAGSTYIWWWKDINNPKYERKIKLGYAFTKPIDGSSESQIEIRIFCAYEPFIQPTQILVQELLEHFLHPDEQPPPIKPRSEWVDDMLDFFDQFEEREQDEKESSNEIREEDKISPIEEPQTMYDRLATIYFNNEKFSPLEEAYLHYHEQQARKEINPSLDRYTLKDLADDFDYNYNYLKNKHKVKCPVCKEAPSEN